MPRDGSGNYTAPFPDVVTATPVASTVYNGFVHDIATDLNAPRPIVAGGTGAASATAARAALTAEAYGQIVTNYDSYSFLPGSFYSDSAATSPPVAGHAFTGVCAFVDGNNMYLQAFDRDDSSQPGAVWIRQKKAGVWSSWAKAQALNIVGTPVANQFTTWQSSTALQGVAITGLVKGNGASAPAAAVANTDYLPVNNPAMTGAPTAPTAAANTNTTQIATTAYADTGLALKAPLASPTFTGNPQAPNPPGGDNDTSIATTAFVTAVAVRYDLAQALSAGQKTQGMTNIGVATGSVIGSSLTAYTSSTALTTRVPADNTVPTNTEGNQIISASYTPQFSTSTLRCTFRGVCASAAADNAAVSIFQGATNIAGQLINTSGANTKHVFTLCAEYAPGSTSAQTITVRAGGATQDLYFNGTSTGGLLGGVQAATLLIEEIKA
jgi:hypothetical protein